MSFTESMLSPVPGNPLVGLRQADRLWQAYRDHTLPVPTVVQTSSEPLESIDWDVVICGGTLGILIATALVKRGWRVAVVERSLLRGRDQEWNISRRELQTLIELDLLTSTELEQAIVTEYNPARIAFPDGQHHKGVELWVDDVLNVGVDPVFLLDTLKTKFLQAGGTLLEQTGFEQAIVHPNGVALTLTSTLTAQSSGLNTRLLLDAMGHFSPIVRQSRGGAQPDAVCMVVGTCAQGFADNETGDLFVSLTPTRQQRQYFWEAFPARDGRTTYLFTYVDAHPDRPSLEALFDDYWQLLPGYQNVDLSQLHIKRALYGFFPCYRHSPLQPKWHRILAIGDSSGAQSPLSFGGFGAIIRHVQRLSQGIHEALQADLLDRHALALLQPYQPSLAVTWLFQRSMSVKVDQSIDPDQINALLANVFREMDQLGDRVLKPFLQDVVQFPALFQTLARVSLTHPGLVLTILPHVGLPTLLNWLAHYANLGLYTGLYYTSRWLQPWLSTLPNPARYYSQRWLEAWQYGAGMDYE